VGSASAYCARSGTVSRFRATICFDLPHPCAISDSVDVTEPKRIRLALVEDNPDVVRQVIKIVSDEFEIVGTFDTGEGVESALAKCEPDVIVLDITLPGRSGIAVASRLTKSGCPARIVVLTVHRDADYVRSSLAAGASGYVVKMRLSLDLERALKAALAGERFVSPLPELNVE